MKRRALLFAACFLAVLPSCSQSPSDLPSLTVNRPTGGEVFELGTPVTVSWTCRGCEAIIGTHGVTVYVSGPTNSPVRIVRVPIGLGGPTDSFVWIAGESLSGSRRLLNPGTYYLSVHTLPTNTESISATSHTFQLVVTGH